MILSYFQQYLVGYSDVHFKEYADLIIFLVFCYLISSSTKIFTMLVEISTRSSKPEYKKILKLNLK